LYICEAQAGQQCTNEAKVKDTKSDSTTRHRCKFITKEQDTSSAFCTTSCSIGSLRSQQMA
jgi:hypothetical protein